MPAATSQEQFFSAIRLFYIYTTGFILTSASYSVTEYLREEDEVQSPYWFILYGGLFTVATVAAHFAAKYPVAHETPNNKRELIAKVQGSLHFVAETIEDGLLLTGIVSDFSADTPNDSGPLLLAFITFAALRSLLLRHHHDNPSRVVSEFNTWIYNALKCMGVFYGLGNNWLYNDLNIFSPEQVARSAVITGASLVTLSNIVERLTRRYDVISESTALRARRGALMLEEMASANIFFTVLVTNTTANILHCEEECSQNAVSAAFYAGNSLGMLLGIGRALNLIDYKPHRLTLEAKGESAPLIARTDPAPDANNHKTPSV